MTPVPLTSAIIEDNEKVLLYGHPSMGKTHAALTAPGPIYFLAIGGPNEVKPYFGKNFQDKHGKKEIIIDIAREPRGKKGRFINAVGFDIACTLLDEALELDDRGKIEFATIVIDNATVLEEFQMNKVIQISDATRSADSKGESTYSKFMDSGILHPADHDWGAAQSLMQKFTSWLFSLDKNVVFVAHEHETTVANRATQSSDIIAVKPLFVGKQRTRIANMFDNVWRFYTHGQLYVARTTPQDKPFTVIAKTRIGGVISPDYPDVNLTKAFKKLQDQARKIDVKK